MNKLEKAGGTIYWVAAAGLIGYLWWKSRATPTPEQIAAVNAQRAAAGQLPIHP